MQYRWINDTAGFICLGISCPAYRPQTRRNITGTTGNFSARPKRIQRVDEWLRRIQYFRRVEAIANLPAVCSEKYALILQQCRAGREFAFPQFGTAINLEPTAVRRPRLTRVRPNVLPIELVSIADG